MSRLLFDSTFVILDASPMADRFSDSNKFVLAGLSEWRLEMTGQGFLLGDCELDAVAEEGLGNSRSREVSSRIFLLVPVQDEKVCTIWGDSGGICLLAVSGEVEMLWLCLMTGL